MSAAWIARLGRDARGAALTEFGLILVPLSVVLLGTFDLGYQSYVRSVLQGALNDVARTASVETPDFGARTGTVEQRIETALKDKVSVLGRSGTFDVKISNYYRFSGVGKPERLVTDVNGNGRYDPGDCWLDTNPNGVFDLDSGKSGLGGADDIAFYEVTLRKPRLLPLSGLMGISPNYEFRATTAMRTQPYANQKQPEVKC